MSTIEAKAKKPLNEMNAKEILALAVPGYPSHDSPEYFQRWREREQIEHAQEQVRDEQAYARVLARKCQRPDKGWPLEHDDPRREEWRKTLLDEIQAALGALPGKDLYTTPAGIRTIAGMVADACRSLDLLQEEVDALEKAGGWPAPEPVEADESEAHDADEKPF